MISYNELQIWDWVKHKTLGVQQVSFLDAYGDIGLGMGNENPYQENDLDPIPLTKEILALNGFKSETYQKGYDTYGQMYILEVTDKTGYDVLVEVRPLDSKNFFLGVSYLNTDIRAHFSFVHQLQNTLRMVGLHEIANDFKVEDNTELITQ